MRWLMTSTKFGAKNFLQLSILTSDLQFSWGHFATIPLSNLTSTCCFIQEKQYLCRQPSTENILSTSVSSKQITHVSFNLPLLVSSAQIIWETIASLADLNANLILLRATRDGLQYVNFLWRRATWLTNVTVLLCRGGTLPVTCIQIYNVTTSIFVSEECSLLGFTNTDKELS